MKRTFFDSCHPVIRVLFFAAVLIGSMWLRHPVVLGIGLSAGAAYALMLDRSRAARLLFRAAGPVCLLAAILNPLFVHEGATVLGYLPWGNPLTLESILYGLCVAGMLAETLCWFFCASTLIDSDHLLWLLGRSVPGLSLLLSMTLGMVPRLIAKIREIQSAQAALGLTRHGFFGRLRGSLRVWSIAVTWSLENGIHTADSMLSRGYGLPGRTCFRRQRFCRRDLVLTVWILALCAFLLLGVCSGGLDWQFYPVVGGAAAGAPALYAAYALLCFFPICCTIIDRKQKRQHRKRDL